MMSNPFFLSHIFKSWLVFKNFCKNCIFILINLNIFIEFSKSFYDWRVNKTQKGLDSWVKFNVWLHNPVFASRKEEPRFPACTESYDSAGILRKHGSYAFQKHLVYLPWKMSIMLIFLNNAIQKETTCFSDVIPLCIISRLSNYPFWKVF